MDIFGKARDQNDRDGKEQGESQAQGGVLPDQAGMIKRFRQNHSRHPGQGGANDEPGRGGIACHAEDIGHQQKSDHNAQQHGMTNGIAGQGHAAQQQKTAQHGAADGDEAAD